MRDALGYFPTGVVIITATSYEGERLGATVSSFNSVSLDPPLVLFSIDKMAKSLAQWVATKHYAVNVLHEDQTEISNRFARAMTDKWEGVMPKKASHITAPLIPNALCWFECESWAHYDGGDHVIFVGKVLGLQVRPTTHDRPLTFFRGRYSKLGNTASDKQKWQHDNFLQHGW
jgi:flavin reductase (DIM6/NTAB) family NADH-FMN oxidoreductase RutF